MKTYNSIAKTAATLEKEIKNYAENVKDNHCADDAMVEFTGYDFNRESMTAEITLKTVIDRKNHYEYIKVVARKVFDNDVSVGVLERKESRWNYTPGSIPEEHGFGAMIMAF